MSELAAACAMALMLYLTWHRSRGPFGLPIILIGGVIVAHLVFWIVGISPAAGPGSTGWTFRALRRTSAFMLPWTRTRLPTIPGTRCAGPARQSDRGGLRHGDQHAVQHHRHRSRGCIARPIWNANSTSPALPTSWPDALGGYTRLHFIQPNHAEFQRRRHRPAVRPDRSRGLGADAGGGPDAARLHAEIRARRAPDLSGRGPAAQMDRRVAASG